MTLNFGDIAHKRQRTISPIGFNVTRLNRHRRRTPLSRISVLTKLSGLSDSI